MRIYIHTLFSLLFLNIIPGLSRAQTPETRVAEFFFAESGIHRYESKDVAVLPDSSVLIATRYRTVYTDSIGNRPRQRRIVGGGIIWLDARLEKKREWIWTDRYLDKIWSYNGRIFLSGNTHIGPWRYNPVWIAEMDTDGQLLWETTICKNCQYTFVQDLKADSAGNLYLLLLKEREYTRERMRKGKFPLPDGDTILRRYKSDIRDDMELWRISAAGKPEWKKTLAEPNYGGLYEGKLNIIKDDFDITFYDLLMHQTRHVWLSADGTLWELPLLPEEEIYFTRTGRLVWNGYTHTLKSYDGTLLKYNNSTPEMRLPEFLLDSGTSGYQAFAFDGYMYKGKLFKCIWLNEDLSVKGWKNYPQEEKIIVEHVALLPDGSVLLLCRELLYKGDPDNYGYIQLQHLQP